MKLLIIRHAIAMDKIEFHRTNSDDSQRPLTDEGRRKMRKNALGLKRIVPEIDLLASSPFVRAEQTAAIVADVYNGTPIELCEPMKPDQAPQALLDWVNKKLKSVSTKTEDPIVAVVGHEPHLSVLLNFIIAGDEAPLFEMKKGGACLFSFEDDEVISGQAELQWVLKPSVLRKLAKD